MCKKLAVAAQGGSGGGGRRPARAEGPSMSALRPRSRRPKRDGPEAALTPVLLCCTWQQPGTQGSWHMGEAERSGEGGALTSSGPTPEKICW